jgi:acyl carrier protein
VSISSTFDRVKRVVNIHLDAGDRITPESTFSDLSADDLDKLEITMALEEEFGTEVPDEEIDRWRTIGDVVRFFNEL